MDLAAYLRRIGFAGEPAPDLATLRAVQRLHLTAIPYENLDVQLGRPLTTEPAAAVAKLVGARRGGWCYEMNGALGWALKEIGFQVRRLASAVMRRDFGDGAIGNHLVLRIDLDGTSFLADAGLGDGPLTPYRVTDGAFAAGGFDYRLEALEGGWWRLCNRPGGRPPDFDFHLDNADEAALASTCLALQTDPSSLFVKNLICQRFVPGGHIQLLGKVLRRTTAAGVADEIVGSPGELIDVLARDFNIDEPEAAALWPAITARHDELFG